MAPPYVKFYVRVFLFFIRKIAGRQAFCAVFSAAVLDIIFGIAYYPYYDESLSIHEKNFYFAADSSRDMGPEYRCR